MKLADPLCSTPTALFSLAAATAFSLISVTAAGCASKDADKGDNAASDPTAGKTMQGKDTDTTASVPKKDPPPPLAELPADSGEHVGKHEWSLRLGGLERDSARDVAFDKEGNAYIGGLISGGATIAGTKMTADGIDAVVVKLSPKGKPIWARHFGGPGPDMAEAIAVDGAGNVIVAGSFGDSLVIGDASLRSAGSDDCFVAKFSPDGKRLWAKRMGGIAEDDVADVVVDKDGNVLVSASFRDRVTLDGTDHFSKGLDDAFVISLDPAGSFRWVARLASAGSDFGRALATSPSGSVVWLAEFSQTAEIGATSIVSAGNRDWALVELDSAGKPVWAASYGGLADDVAFGLARDPAGDLIVTGGFSETMSVGAFKLKSHGEADAFVAKIAHDGTPRWAEAYGGKLADNGAAVATDRFGNIYAGGTFRGTVEFGGGPLTSRGKNLMKDVFVMALGPDGKRRWVKQFGGEQDDYTRAIGITSGDQPVVVGTFYTSINLGGDDLVEDHGSALLPAGEMFVTKLSR